MLREEKSLSEMRRKKYIKIVTLEKKNNKKQTNSSMYVAEMDYGERTPVVLINRERRGKNNTKRKEGNKVGGGPAKTQHKRTTKQRQYRHTQNMKINNEKKTKETWRNGGVRHRRRNLGKANRAGEEESYLQ